MLKNAVNTTAKSTVGKKRSSGCSSDELLIEALESQEFEKPQASDDSSSESGDESHSSNQD